MGLSQNFDCCNDKFTLIGFLLPHNVKFVHVRHQEQEPQNIGHQEQDPQKLKKMRFYYVVSVGTRAKKSSATRNQRDKRETMRENIGKNGSRWKSVEKPIHKGGNILGHRCHPRTNAINPH
jgi:hypothetical protein